MAELDATSLNAILTGATVYGAGGGGPYALGEAFVANIAARMASLGRGVQLVSMLELEPSKFVAIPAGVGSPSAAEDAPFPLDAVTKAFTTLGRVTGRSFAAVLPGEVGAGNSLIPVSVALDLNIPVLDASGAARAMPSLQMSTCAGLPVSPVIMENASTMVQFSAEPAELADATMRGIIGGGVFTEDAGVALWPMTVAEAGCCIPRTLTNALELGKVILGAVAAKTDPVAAAVTFMGATILVVGTVQAVVASTGGGFDHSIVTISDGTTTVRITGQNENLLTWVNDESAPRVIAPDLVCFLGVDGTPYSNADLPAPGSATKLAVLAAPTPAQGRTASTVSAYLDLYRQLGYGGGYAPFT